MAQTVEIPGVGDVDFPDSMSKEQIVAAIQKLPAPKNIPQNRGNVINTDVPTVVGERANAINAQPAAKPVTMMDRVKTLYEVPRAIAGSIISEPLSMAYGVARSIPEAIATGQNAPELANKYYEQASKAMQYQPTSPESQAVLGTIGDALNAAKIPAYTPVIGKIPSAMQAAGAIRPVLQESVMPVANKMASALRNEAQMIREAVQPATSRVSQIIEPVATKVSDMADALRAKVNVEGAPTMSGVGAAEVPLAVNRTQMAEQLRVPIKLSKGQATRDLGQQQFEAETMKTYPEDVGRPLIQAQEQRNALIGQNLDAYVDATGAKVANEFYLRPTGEAVDAALRESANNARKSYKNAYEVARASEEGKQKVNVQGIIDQLDNLEAEAVNAPVIDSAKIKLNKLAKNGEMTLNEIEEVRKMVNRLSGDSPSNMAFGGDIKTMIDTVTKNAGGDLFKEARRLRIKFANEFENIGLIDDLLSTKTNSKDRVIAMEKVFDKAIMQSDLDSLKGLGYTLKKTEKGQQAWAELKGQTIENLRSAITSNIETDSLGQRTFNPKQFDVIIKNLDKSGKLDYLLGKAGAQEIRNLRDTVININSPVKGINSSNTSSAINKVFNGILKKTVGKVPLAGSLVEAGVEAVEKKNISKQVEKSLEFNAKDVANELRKGK
jgi:hypothetical protein